MRRLGRLIVASVVVLGALVAGLVSFSTGAAAVGFAATSAGCSGPAGYPVQTGATVSVSTTTPYRGQTITVSGRNFRAGETVTVYLDGHQAASTTADSKGTFTVQVKVTSQPGKVQVRAVGAVCGVASLSLLVRLASGVEPTSAQATPPGAAAGASSGSGGLAFTGLDIVALVAIALLLVGAGVYLTRAGRRRRAHS